ncbi:MAG TPA: aromatic ring-hydroxylating dioxygenase subunit alpha [Acidisoma sp.]|uniref:aromatic ring-hydroxylating dioxygenase subunit alpha n=1 Tax=Acidisoma sp. TaxID=1872115 RepID=UPI002BE03F49|nr:aromatic ring-hydroxylating dioxygenase subunit alpha [Acidisoma sp.]HTI01029.1 aromatic ring-hydroxylating dioxygenase subunit alpha [Acidisoma sp.]
MDQGFLPAEEAPTDGDSGRDLRRVGAHPDHWYPLAWSGEVKPGKTLAVRFAGDPIVLARPKDGGPVFALADRCAHRQVPLSRGLVEGCAIRCGYHGWAYDQSGHCTDVPYIGKGKLPNGVRAYPTREKDGLILVFPGDAELAETTPLPALGSVANPAYKTRRFGQVVGCHYSFMHENLMDMNHQFLHRKQMGQMRPRFLGQAQGEDWVEARYSFARTGGKQPWGEAAIFGQKRSNAAEFADKDVMTIRTEYPYQTLRIRMKDETPVMDLWIAYVPQDREQRTNRTFGLLSVHRPKIPFVLDLAWPLLIIFTERIFKEDREIVEMEQAAHDAQGCDLNQEVFPVIRSLRALLAEHGTTEDVPRLGTQPALA